MSAPRKLRTVATCASLLLFCIAAPASSQSRVPSDTPIGPPGVDSTGGGWTPLVVPPGIARNPGERYLHTAILDQAGNRMVVFGGLCASYVYGDVWALPLGTNAGWAPLAVSSSGSPGSLRDHSAVYDPVRHRMLVFGGSGYLDSFSNETYALSLDASPAWSAVSAAGAPPSGRFAHTAIYDPVRDRMIVFGGYNGSSFLNDAWALSLSGTPTWSPMVASGPLPAGRNAMTAIYDPARDRMIVFGGWDGSQFRNDVWALDLAGSPSWTQLLPTGTSPSPRRHYAAAYDASRDRIVMMGGYDFSLLNDVWALSLSGTPAWSQVAPAGTPPRGRSGHRAVYDAAKDRFVLFGGYAVNPEACLNDTPTLLFSGSPTWAPTIPPALVPPPRRDQVAIYDPVRDRLVIFGGAAGDYNQILFNDTWALSLGASPSWSQVTTSGTSPSRRMAHAGAYDPVRDRLIVFGGFDGGAFINDVWALSLSGTPTWTPIPVSGPAPAGRNSMTAIYDPVRDRVVLFGGWSGSAFLGDVWALSLSGTPSWTLLEPGIRHPSARRHYAAVYDPTLDQMVISGGYDLSYLGDSWAYGFGSGGWRQLQSGRPQPSARNSHRAIFDPDLHRMVIFGGYDGNYRNDTWALSLDRPDRWTELVPTGMPPTRRLLHTATYDPLRRRMIVFGGRDGVRELNDTWALELPPVPPSASQATDRRGPQALPATTAFALNGIEPNPAVHDFAVDLSLPDSGPAELTVFDIKGALVQKVYLSALGPGRHVLQVGRGARLPAGLYLVRLTRGNETRALKTVIMR